MAPEVVNRIRGSKCFSGELERGFSQKSRLSNAAYSFTGWPVRMDS